MSFDKQQNQQTNRQIKLASRPNGVPTADNFDMATSDIPMPNANEMLLRTVYLSLDPYMRGRMSDAKSYADPLEIGDVYQRKYPHTVTLVLLLSRRERSIWKGRWLAGLPARRSAAAGRRGGYLP